MPEIRGLMLRCNRWRARMTHVFYTTIVSVEPGLGRLPGCSGYLRCSSSTYPNPSQRSTIGRRRPAIGRSWPGILQCTRLIGSKEEPEMPSRSASARPIRGFTLIELIVTVAIVAILAAIAFPQFQEITLRMATTTNTNNMVNALNIARSEAVKRGRPVAVIPIGDDWSKGWQVVAAAVDADGSLEEPKSPGNTAAACEGYMDNAVDADSTVPLCVLHQPALEGGFTLHGKADGSDTTKRVMFRPVGSLAGDVKKYHFSLCRPEDRKDPAESRQIIVAGSGAVETRRDTTGAHAHSCE